MVDKYMYVLYMLSSKNKGIIIIEPGFNCWTSVTPAFQSWFAVEYSSCFISVMNLDLYVRCFDSLI